MSALEAQRVRGPSALAGGTRRMAHLAVTLALTEWKLRFFGSVLGYVWSLLRPLMLFGILYLVFSQLVAIGNGIPHYPLLLLAGLVLFATFSEITSASVTAVLDRETLVRKVAFPRLAVPLSVTVLASFGLLLNLVTVAVFVALSGVEPRWSWLLLPLPLLAMLAFATGIGMLLAALYVPFRDVRPIWDVIAQALFYATPIFWPVQALADQPEWLARLVMSNPVAVLIQEFRRLLVGPAVPSPADLVGWAWLAVPALIVVALLGVGFAVFSRMAPHMAEDL